MLLALLLAIGGLVALFARSVLLGVVLIGVACVLSRYAKNARAAHLHRQKMTGLWKWAQGLGPRSRRGGSRPW
jgi:hypothetical protein